MDPLILACLLVGGSLLACGEDRLPSYPSPLVADEAPHVLLTLSAARHPRDVPLSSYGRLGEREDDNSTTTTNTTAVPIVETTETSTEMKQEITVPPTTTTKGPFEFGFNLPGGYSFHINGPQTPGQANSQGQAAGGAPAAPSGFPQAPKLPIPNFGFGRK